MGSKKAPTQTGTTIDIPPMQIKTITLAVVGDSPLLMNRFDEKSKQQMIDKQTGKARDAKAPRDPQAEYEKSIYRREDGTPCIPGAMFKGAGVNACSFVEGISKVEARGAFHVAEDMIEIHGDPSMREDTVRLNGPGRKAMLRYRAQFKTWWCSFTVRYDQTVLQPSQIAHLFNKAGFSIGVGEWRPQHNGSMGMFHVMTEADAKKIGVKVSEEAA